MNMKYDNPTLSSNERIDGRRLAGTLLTFAAVLIGAGAIGAWLPYLLGSVALASAIAGCIGANRHRPPVFGYAPFADFVLVANFGVAIGFTLRVAERHETPSLIPTFFGTVLWLAIVVLLVLKGVRGPDDRA
jgi:uncharacterized membrane protein AbrB (regulator of aidB expression)